jgi:hypothetical protein
LLWSAPEFLERHDSPPEGRDRTTELGEADMSLVAWVIRQFHEGAEAVSLERLVALPHQPTMGTKLVILTDEGVTPELEVIGLTMRAAPDGPGFKPPVFDVLLAFEPLTAAGRALELG